MLEFSFQRLQLEEHGVCAEVNCSLHLRDDEFTVIRAQGDRRVLLRGMWGQSCQERQLESPQNTLIHLPEWFRSNLNTHSSSRPGNTPGVTSGVFSPIPHAVCSRGLPVAVGLSPWGRRMQDRRGSLHYTPAREEEKTVPGSGEPSGDPRA